MKKLVLFLMCVAALCNSALAGLTINQGSISDAEIYCTVNLKIDLNSVLTEEYLGYDGSSIQTISREVDWLMGDNNLKYFCNILSGSDEFQFDTIYNNTSAGRGLMDQPSVPMNYFEISMNNHGFSSFEINTLYYFVGADAYHVDNIGEIFDSGNNKTYFYGDDITTFYHLNADFGITLGSEGEISIKLGYCDGIPDNGQQGGGDSGAVTVPAPGAIVLSAIGTGLVGFVRRRNI